VLYVKLFCGKTPIFLVGVFYTNINRSILGHDAWYM